MKNLNDHIKKYGYNLSYSYDDNECSLALKKELGTLEYKKYCKAVQQFEKQQEEKDVEQYIRDYLKKYPRAIKILISGQIAISIKILEFIIENLEEDISEKNFGNVLELGGADGWSADYLINYFTTIEKIDVVDKNYFNSNTNSKIEIISCTYSDYISNKKYDLVYSILGSPYFELDEMIGCIKKNIGKNGIVYLGLRLQSYEYAKFQQQMKDNGFDIYKNGIDRIYVKLATGAQVLPLFKFIYDK